MRKGKVYTPDQYDSMMNPIGTINREFSRGFASFPVNSVRVEARCESETTGNYY